MRAAGVFVNMVTLQDIIRLGNGAVGFAVGQQIRNATAARQRNAWLVGRVAGFVIVVVVLVHAEDHLRPIVIGVSNLDFRHHVGFHHLPAVRQVGVSGNGAAAFVLVGNGSGYGVANGVTGHGVPIPAAQVKRGQCGVLRQGVCYRFPVPAKVQHVNC